VIDTIVIRDTASRGVAEVRRAFPSDELFARYDRTTDQLL